MQDRFKFRIFCKSENKMMLFNNPTLIDGDILEGGLLFKNYDHKIKNVHEVKSSDLILMQCTGLKDKNGKLIFEGDIIQIPDNWDEYGMMAGEKREIYFNEGGFRLKPKWNKNARGNWLEDTKDFEVIGNIYENKELLDESI